MKNKNKNRVAKKNLLTYRLIKKDKAARIFIILKNHYLQTKSERRQRCVFHLCDGEWEEESREEEALESGKKKRWEDIVLPPGIFLILKNQYLQTKSGRKQRCVFHLCDGEWEEESREEEALESGKKKWWDDIVLPHRIAV
nr:hypothetical protein [Tanacetum cinerariifolium]GEY84428.1 hypothetical protein [Tanacetum cinerariifolium]